MFRSGRPSNKPEHNQRRRRRRERTANKRKLISAPTGRQTTTTSTSHQTDRRVEYICAWRKCIIRQRAREGEPSSKSKTYELNWRARGAGWLAQSDCVCSMFGSAATNAWWLLATDERMCRARAHECVFLEWIYGHMNAKLGVLLEILTAYGTPSTTTTAANLAIAVCVAL